LTVVQPVSIKEILPFQQYEILRPRLRPLFIAEKNRRRLAVGDHMTLLFENGRTVWYQVEEMLRAEKISDDAAIRHEIDTYNELLPKLGELAATMLLEFPDVQQRDVALRQLLGLETHIWIKLDDWRERARFDLRQMASDRISSVQFVHFRLGGIDAEQFVQLSDEGKITIEVDHPNLQASAHIDSALARVLADDLAR
jgi:hypothetical protein